MNPQNIPTWAEETRAIESTSRFWGNKKFAVLWASIAALAWVALTQLDNDANAQTAPAKVEAEMPESEVIKTAQLQTIKPTPASFSTSESNEKVASLDEILEAGKAEWMENTKAEYWEEAAEIWDETVEELNVEWKETMSKFVVKDLQEFTPNMLLQFADLDRSIYPKLASMWETEAEKAETEAEKAETEAEKAETEAEKAETEAEKAETENAKKWTQIAEVLAWISN